MELLCSNNAEHHYLEGAGSTWDQGGPSKALFPKHKALSRSLGAAPPETGCGNSCGVGFFCFATHTLKREQSLFPNTVCAFYGPNN